MPYRNTFSILSIGLALLVCMGPRSAEAQNSNGPRVTVPTGKPPVVHSRSSSAVSPYPWKKYITATIFWCGEQPTPRNPTPNCKSSWDTKWAINFGGYDDPDPENRIADHRTGEFRPKKFIPKLNPFYIALPYNDVIRYNQHKPEARKVIPWFKRHNPAPGKTVLKGKWVQIFVNGKSCYAQWEDCGPWVTDDWQYVFGNKPPKATQNGAAGIDLSPSVRDYLGAKSGTKVHWRFIDAKRVPYGPWKKYGNHNTMAANEAHRHGQQRAQKSPADDQNLEAQQKYLEHLKKLRDARFMKTPLNEL